MYCCFCDVIMVQGQRNRLTDTARKTTFVTASDNGLTVGVLVMRYAINR